MRRDMAKVIVERPRRGSRYMKYHNVRSREKRQMYDAPMKQGMRYHHRRTGREWRELNEHLEPLKRYLRSQVGRPWNDVYSEISEHVRVTNAVQQHIRDHVKWEVATNTMMVDGRRYVHTSLWPSPLGPNELYVDDHGVLRLTPPRSRRAAWESRMRSLGYDLKKLASAL